MGDPSQDERGFTRVRAAVYVTVEAEGQTARGFSQDLSLSGFFLPARPPLRAGAPCLCTLQLTGPGVEPSLRLRARITRSTVLGFAVQFESVLDPENLEQLHTLLVLNSAEPDKMREELARTLGLRKQIP